MKKYLGFVAVSLFLLSCTNTDRDNPYDMYAVNYIGNISAEGSSSSVETDDEPSSSSVVYSGGSVEPSSSFVEPSSSSIVPSSSSVEPSSSSAEPSSSSEEGFSSSSSIAPSSSSAPQSSSSIAPSSSSSVPAFACAMTATTGTVGVAISPAPAVTCNGSTVTAGLAWTPANYTPTTSGSVSVSVSASSGVCSGRVAQCGSVTVTVYSGKGNNISSYKTVRIGDQTWMAENLNYVVEGSKCYSNSSANCDKYGSLYNWATAMGLPSSCNSNICSSQIQSPHRGICPLGYHIPSPSEWNTLSSYVQSTSGCGGCDAKLLKATSGWSNKNDGSSGNGTDEYGFSALPGGLGYSDGSFSNVGDHGRWWCASENCNQSAYGRSMSGADYTNWLGYGKSDLFSVRCLQD